MKRRAFLAASAGAAVAACAPAASDAGLTADPQRKRWPDFVRRSTAEVQAAYAYAVADRTLLQWIPCYCGCGSPSHGEPHGSNHDCFVRRLNPDGTAVLDPHGADCGTCVSIALESRGLAWSGKTPLEIRAAIDAKWSKVGPGTPTPPIG